MIQRQELAGRIAALPWDERIVLGLVYEHSLSMAEAAAVLELPVGVAAERHAEAIAKMLSPC